MKQFFAAALLLFVTFGCTTTAEKKKDPVIASAAFGELFQQAKKDIQKKDYTKAIQKLNKITREAPESELAAESHLTIGDV